MHLSSVFLKSCQLNASRWLHPGVSYNDVYKKSSVYLYYLRHQLKLRPQERIAVYSPKSYLWAPFLIACFRNNNIVIPLPSAPSSRSSETLISMTRPKIVLDTLHGMEESVMTETNEIPIRYTSESPAFILFTAGSSATPKAVVLSHHNIYSNLHQMDKVLRWIVSSEDRSYSLLPWYHCYGLVCELLYTMMKGSQIIVSGYQHPYENLKRMSSFHPTVIQTVPKMLYGIETFTKESLLWKWLTPSLRKRMLFGSNLRFLTVGGAHSMVSTLEYIHTQFESPIYQGYGMTEMSPMVSLSTHSQDYRSVGPLLSHIESYIDPETQELYVKGPNQMMGYLQGIVSPTVMNIDPFYGRENSWYRTGDKASMNEEGCLMIEGRISDIYKMSNGKFVNPIYLESLVEVDPRIQQCLIFSKTGIYNQALIYSSDTNTSATSLMSILHTILESHQISSLLWPRQLCLLKHPFSVENGYLSLKQEKRRSIILSHWEKGTLECI